MLDARSLPASSRPVELSPGRVYALGGAVALDGRVSWVPGSASGWAPASCYLIVSGDGALLIDTGLGTHAKRVVAQLRALLPERPPLSILLTRTEMDCALNVPAIEQWFEVAAVRYTGGITVPRLRDGAAGVRFTVDPGTAQRLEAAPGVELELISPRLRLLPTVWPYDPVSGTLFTSDAFGHVYAPAIGTPAVATAQEGAEPPGEEHVRRHLLAKLSWLTETDTAPIADDIRRVFAEREVTRIAPTHGRVIAGAGLVAEHARMLERVVRAVGR